MLAMYHSAWVVGHAAPLALEYLATAAAAAAGVAAVQANGVHASAMDAVPYMAQIVDQTVANMATACSCCT